VNARRRLTLDLIAGFHRSEHKARKLSSFAAYFASKAAPLRALDKWRARLPIHGYLLLTTRCNMSCDDCCFVDVINKKGIGRLDFDLSGIRELYEQPIFRSVSRVVLFGGEPTLCKCYADTIRFFRSKGIVVCLTSNALRVNAKALTLMRDADLNMLNLTIYDKTERGQLYNMDKLEAAFQAIHEGAFDVDRVGLCFHATEIGRYRSAYQFALKLRARHLLFNRTYYTPENPYSPFNKFVEREGFGAQYNELCAEIEREGCIKLYRPIPGGDPKVCTYTSNSVVVGPTGALSPCCLLTPKEQFGSISDPQRLMAFKDKFIERTVPTPCKGCHMLGLKSL
jgi:MoaA/NifB/PqqE/SkfB family radical SAM enzyme